MYTEAIETKKKQALTPAGIEPMTFQVHSTWY